MCGFESVGFILKVTSFSSLTFASSMLDSIVCVIPPSINKFIDMSVVLPENNLKLTCTSKGNPFVYVIGILFNNSIVVPVSEPDVVGNKYNCCNAGE